MDPDLKREEQRARLNALALKVQGVIAEQTVLIEEIRQAEEAAEIPQKERLNINLDDPKLCTAEIRDQIRAYLRRLNGE